MMPHPDPEGLGTLLAQVCRLQHARAHELLEELGLYRGQHAVLRALWEGEGLTQTELAERAHVRAATISKTIQRMEEVGLVERRPDAQDARVSHVYLSPAGRDLQRDVEERWQQLEAEVYAGLGPEERDLLRRCFDQMRENLLRVTRQGEHKAYHARGPRGHRAFRARRPGGRRAAHAEAPTPDES
jgi:DNA-binding MarR family transcriptional regulator